MGGIAEVDKTGLVTSLSFGEVGKNFVEKQDNGDLEENSDSLEQKLTTEQYDSELAFQPQKKTRVERKHFNLVSNFPNLV